MAGETIARVSKQLWKDKIMYKWINYAELDNCGYEYVEEDERCEDCGEWYRNCECSDLIEDDDDEAPFDERYYSR